MARREREVGGRREYSKALPTYAFDIIPPSLLLLVYGSKSWCGPGRLGLCNVCHLQCK